MSKKVETLRDQIKGKTDKEDRARVFKSLIGDSEEPILTVPTVQTDSTRPIKSRRLNVRLFPDVYEDFKTVASMKRTNVNDLLNEVMAAYNEEHKDLIAKYHEFIKED